MTEIPEHLLKRSRERRAALGLGGDAPPSEAADESESPAASAPAPTGSAAPAPAAAATPAPVEEPRPESPTPEPAYIQAAQRRRRVPYWAMPVLAGLPLWAYVYVSTLSPPPVENDPLTLGEEVYNSAGCVGCHGGDGAGSGAIPGFADGQVVETWPDPIDHMVWVRLGAPGWPGETYGAQNKREPLGTMPAHPGLSDEELAQVVLYERRTLGGEFADEAPPDPEEDVLLQVASGELTFADAFAEEDLAPVSKEAGISESTLEGG